MGRDRFLADLWCLVENQSQSRVGEAKPAKRTVVNQLHLLSFRLGPGKKYHPLHLPFASLTKR